MNIARSALGLAFSFGTALLAGCYQPASVAHASLHVLATGSMLLDGRPVDAANLRTEITRLRERHGGLMVEVTPDPAAPLAYSEQAVAAIEGAHARVAFVHPD